MRKYLVVVGWLFYSVCTQANIVINGTRLIYPEKNKDVVVQLMNNGQQPALVQAWIDDGDINSTPETANVPFLLSPPVVKVTGNNGQQLRIKKIGAALPADRESVFYLNVLDIPPTPENLQGVNTLQLAIKSRIKLFYRPTALKSSVDVALKKLSLQAKGKGFDVVNNSPYFVTIANIGQGTNKHLLIDSLMVVPFSTQFAASKVAVKKNSQYSVMYVDDLGGYNSIVITSS